MNSIKRSVQYQTKDITHCPLGHEYTPENTFIRNRHPHKNAKVCRTCQRIWAKKAKTKMMPKRKSWYYDILLNSFCLDCGESRPATLQWDHRDPSLKEFGISDAIRQGHSKKRILEEMAKCDVRCANCHAIRTAEQQGWYKGLI
jgi:hypothetical protein